MTDIVERLRQQATKDTSPGAWFGCYLMDAAAEIERLRDELRVHKDALWKACGDDEAVVNATLESQR